MTLSQLDKNDNARVCNIKGNDKLINRLASFGIVEESEIRVIQFSLGKNVMEVDCDGTSLALRIKEADLVEVQKI